MGVRELIETMKAEALKRMKEERERRKESLKVRTYLPNMKSKERDVERGRRML